MKLKVVQWVLALLLLAPCTQAQSIWDATHLANVKQSIHEPFYATAYQALQAEADKLLDCTASFRYDEREGACQWQQARLHEPGLLSAWTPQSPTDCLT